MVPGKENQNNKVVAKAGRKKQKMTSKKKKKNQSEKIGNAEKLERDQLLQTFSIPKRFFCNGSYEKAHDFHKLQLVRDLAACWDRDVDTYGTFCYYQAHPNCAAINYVKKLCPTYKEKSTYRSAEFNNGMREFDSKGGKRGTRMDIASITVNIAVLQHMERVRFSQGNVALTECISKEADIITEYQLRGWANVEQGQRNITVMACKIETWDENDENDGNDEIDTTCQTAYNQLKKDKVLVSRWDAKEYWHDEIAACAERYQRRYLVLQLIEQIIFELE